MTEITLKHARCKDTLSPTETTVLRMLERAADAGSPCPTNLELALETGRDDVSPIIRALCRKGHIMVESGHKWRIVTLVATGREIASGKAVKIVAGK